MNVYTDLTMMKNKLQQVRLDPLVDDPELTELAEGRIWYNMTEDVFKYYDGRDINILEINNPLTVEDIDVIWELARSN